MHGFISRSAKKFSEGGNTMYDIHVPGQQFRIALNDFYLTFLHILHYHLY